MSTYVDAVRAYPAAGLRFTEYCHLLADTRDELHALAAAVGMPRRAFQDHPWRWHYDLPAHLRPRALELGARVVTMHEVGALLRARRAGQPAATPNPTATPNATASPNPGGPARGIA